MKKKMAIRKLNRTLLKKEGTKELYITGKSILMSFFGIENINDLSTSRNDEESRRLFLIKNKVNTQKLSILNMSVTREGNEVRLTGFKNFFELNGIRETDEIILERIKKDNTEKFYLDFKINNNIKVLQKYNHEDDVNSYEVKNSEKNTIVLNLKDKNTHNYESLYWLWDDSYDLHNWEYIMNKQSEITFITKNNVVIKTIKIVETNESFEKIMKAETNYKNKIVSQTKKLYKILELVDNSWVNADFGDLKNIEFIDEVSRVVLCDRNKDSFCLYEGGNIE